MYFIAEERLKEVIKDEVGEAENDERAFVVRIAKALPLFLKVLKFILKRLLDVLHIEKIDIYALKSSM